jgi:LacI family transcriptional regulator
LHAAIINWDTAVTARLFDDVVNEPLSRRRGRYGSRHKDSVATIAFDDSSAGRLATTHLLELGHTSLVHLRGPNVRSSLLRLIGYRQALEEAGQWPQPVLSATSPTLESREAAVESYLRRTRPPLAMVAYDDLSAVAALRVAHRCGWSVPEDLSIVGIDDIQFAAYTNPSLTTVAQPKQELGALAVEALIGDGASTGAGQLRVLHGELVLRESTTAPRRRGGSRVAVAKHGARPTGAARRGGTSA